MWPHKFYGTIAFIICSFSFSSTSYGVSEEFLRIISNTTLEQEQTFEAEKKIIEAMQNRKVDESGYKPIVEGEFTGSLLLYDNFRKDKGLSDEDKHDFSLTSILKVYDVARKDLIYKSADTHWRQSKVNLGLMLKEGLLKENIDGEALKWAFDKMQRRKGEREQSE